MHQLIVGFNRFFEVENWLECRDLWALGVVRGEEPSAVKSQEQLVWLLH